MAGEQEEKRQKTDFKESACCTFAVFQRAAQQKTFGSGKAHGNWDPGRPKAIYTQCGGVGSSTTNQFDRLSRLLIGADTSPLLDFMPAVLNKQMKSLPVNKATKEVMKQKIS